jgi:hypothetical protein
MKLNHLIPSISLLVFVLLTVTACGTLKVGIELTATPDGAPAARLATRVAAPDTPIHAATGSKPTPTSVLDGSHLSFNDPAFGLSLDIPLWWETHTTPGALTQFFQQDHAGVHQTVLTISALNPESDSLESALDEVTQGAWGPYVREVQRVQLGAFETLRLALSPGADRPPVVWLVVAPSGRALSIIPEIDPALIEPVIEVVLDTLRPINSTTSEATPIPEGPPNITPTHTPALARTISDLVEPLLIDGEKGEIFASAKVDGLPKTVKLATQDGRLMAAYDVVGRLALDRTGGRLFVDRGEAGVAILDAQTGTLQATVTLPKVGPADADPQVDPMTGLAYVFRDKTIYVIDPATAAVTQAVTLSIPISVCGDPGEDAPIVGSFYDLVNHRLYLAFVTYVCTPWVQQTIVAFDAATLAELGRYQTELNCQAVPFSDSLYGTTTSRLGRSVSWAWNGREAWFEEGYDGVVRLQGIVADWGRQLVYEALGGQIRVLKAYPRETIGQVEIALLAGDGMADQWERHGRLAGHDPISDQLYFLVGGQLEVRPTSAILTPPSGQAGDLTPYCRPSEASVNLSASATTLKVGQIVSVTVTLANGDTSGVRLGNIQYLLRVQPLHVFSSDHLEPVVHTLSLEPGQSDTAGFVLRAEIPGRATLTGLTSFEIHAMDYAWGSFSGCDSWPLEIVVTP